MSCKSSVSKIVSKFRSQLGLILRVGLTLKSSSKITLRLILRVGFIIGETRYDGRQLSCSYQVGQLNMSAVA